MSIDPRAPRPDELDELDVRERKLVAAVMEGKNQTQAGLAAGYGGVNGLRAAQTASEKMGSVRVREALRARLAELGLDDAGLAVKARELLESVQHGLTRDGQVVAMGPDNHARVKALDLVFKVVGAYPDPRAETTNNVGAIVVLQSGDAIAGAADPFHQILDVSPKSVDTQTPDTPESIGE